MQKTAKKAPARKKGKATGTAASDLPLAPVIRIAKKSGADRISMGGTRAIVAMTEKYIAAVSREAVRSAALEGRKTVKAADVEKC